MFEDLVGFGRPAGGEAKNANAGAFECVGLEGGSVVGDMGGGVFGGWIRRICAGYCTQHASGSGDVDGNGTSSVLTVADRNDAGAADQADGGLEADDAVDRCGAGDGTIGFGADGGFHLTSRYGGSTAGRRTAWIAIECVRIACLATDRAPAGD